MALSESCQELVKQCQGMGRSSTAAAQALNVHTAARGV
jgi:hypothetical protein